MHGLRRLPRRLATKPPWALLLLALAGGSGALAAGTGTHTDAAPRPGGGAIDASIGLSSGLVTRGISMGSGGPAVQAQATFHAADGWYAGLAAGTFGAPWSRAQAVQVQGRLGLVRRLSDDWSGQLAYAYYGYPLDAPLRRFEYDELALTLGYRDLAFVSLSRWLGRQWRLDRRGLDSAAELVMRQPLAPSFDFTAGIGQRAVDGRWRPGYRYGHVGVAWRHEALQANLAYIATSSRAERWFGAKAADRWAAGLTWSF